MQITVTSRTVLEVLHRDGGYMAETSILAECLRFHGDTMTSEQVMEDIKRLPVILEGLRHHRLAARHYDTKMWRAR